MKTAAILLAAGLGQRMNLGENKIFVSLKGIPMVVRALYPFVQCEKIDEIILVASADREDDHAKVKALLDKLNIQKKIKIVSGGQTRQGSAFRGFAACDETVDIVLFHDVARPMITQEKILAVLRGVEEFGAAILAVREKSTLKIANADDFIEATPNRTRFWQAQTPQGFKREIFQKAIEKALKDNFIGTDDAQLVERLGVPVKLIEDDYENIKVTTPEDISIAESFLKKRGEFADGMQELKNRFQEKFDGIDIPDTSEIKDNFKKFADNFEKNLNETINNPELKDMAENFGKQFQDRLQDLNNVSEAMKEKFEKTMQSDQAKQFVANFQKNADVLQETFLNILQSMTKNNQTAKNKPEEKTEETEKHDKE